jgi:hypothetical protein
LPARAHLCGAESQGAEKGQVLGMKDISRPVRARVMGTRRRANNIFSNWIPA